MPGAAAWDHFNSFRGLAVDPFEVVDDPSHEPLWRDFTEHVRLVWCGADEASTDYVLKWLSSKFTRYWIRLNVSLAIRGEQGTGKGTVIDIMRALLGSPSFWKVHDIDSVVGAWNVPMEKALLIEFEEASFVGNHRQNKSLKALQTADVGAIRQKHQTTRENVPLYF